MRKLIQWSLVTVVAIALMAVVVGQMLAATTGRAREASVAVLKDKLARLEVERAAAKPVADFTSPDANSEEGPSGQVAPTGGSDVRTRWLALFDELPQTWRKCGFEPPVSQRVVVEDVHGVGAGELDATQKERLSDYRACIAPTADALVRLLEETEISDDLFKFTFRPDSDFDEQLWMCGRLLNICFWIDAYHKDYPGIVDAYIGKVKLSSLTLADNSPWMFEPSMIWKILDGALIAETVDPARWERLLEVLKARRTQEFLLEQVRRDTEWVIFAFETWKDRDDWGFRFSEDPVGYMRSWAYPRLTPALFNHDFDRFNRAMDRLLELSAKPYFEVKGDLEQFCVDFDVEPNLESIKFTRGNPGWRYVLSLSRHEIKQNAKNQASIDVIRFALLLEKYKRSHGNYPESLEVFAEALGGSLPVNPLKGNAYVYERSKDSFRLGYHDDEDPKLVAEFGLEPVKVVWWHDPLGYEPEDGVE